MMCTRSLQTLLTSAVLVGLLAVWPTQAVGQGLVDRDHVPSNERVDRLAREQSDIDGNNIRATIFNTGLTGRTGGGRPDEVPYEWPKNTRRHYIALTGLFVGAEVETVSGEDAFLVNLPRFRTDPNNENVSWTFDPIPGYNNPASESIARSDDPSTWPTFWPDKQTDETDPGWRGSWNGFFGKDVFNADQELFYKMGDDQYARPGVEYYPDSTDLSRRGLGLLAETRVLAWSQVLINDVVFVIHNVKNDGTEDLSKVGVTLWLADLVGDDSNRDDFPFYDLLQDVAFMTDLDGQGGEAFQGAEVGAAAAIFLETPGNATDRIDNDGDGSTAADLLAAVGEPGSPVIEEAFLEGECPLTTTGTAFPPGTCYDGIDNNRNGLVDENETYIPFVSSGGIQQAGVGYADRIDNDGDAEEDSPVVTAEMVAAATGDRWNRWPANPAETEPVHLVGVGPEDEGFAFADGLDNDNTCDAPLLARAEEGAPRVTQDMIDAAAADPFGRYAVPGADIVLYQLGPEDLGVCYADGVDNDEDGAVDEGIDEMIDEMIDESRADGIDNDDDWRPGLDDVGLDGAAFTGDTGEGDGQPTSGFGTGLPGEPNIDVTDVSESDQIGITNVQYVPAGGIDYQRISDRELYNRFMVPGQFFDPSILADGGDFDLFVSSGVFPLAAGQTERISYAVLLGEDNRNAGSFDQRFRDLLGKRDNAQNAYLADYRFAQAPLAPNVTAVPGNGQVTLYWDAEAEESFDSFLADIGLPPNDFEGYKVYRSTDPAFLDARVITDGFGNQRFLRPIGQFDLVNEFGGFHPVAVDGTQFYLGDNNRDPGEGSNGLTHVFVDSTVTNGITYYYAVTAYDYGAVSANIAPSESPIRIRFEADGSIATGPNVVEVTPTASASGVVDAQLDTNEDGFLPRVEGFTSSRIGYRVVDPRGIIDGNRYRVVFEDTLIAGGAFAADTITTKNFSLIDLSAGDTLITRSQAFRPGQEPAVVDGFQLLFFADPFIVLNESASGWNEDNIFPAELEPYVQGRIRGVRTPFDYRVEFLAPEQGRSIELALGTNTVPARATNFRVVNVTTGEEVPYVFLDRDGSDGGAFAETPARFTIDPDFDSPPASRSPVSDFIILVEERPDGETDVTWRISYSNAVNVLDSDSVRLPEEGDVLTLITRKPFLQEDVFEFTASAPQVDVEAARAALDDVGVVPNPYRAASLFEGVNPRTTGRGEREIRFVNLPPQCTIRIFTVSGHLVREIQHNAGSNEAITAGQLLNGEAAWNLESQDNLTVSYGVYLYHIEAPGIGETTGTFAIIK